MNFDNLLFNLLNSDEVCLPNDQYAELRNSIQNLQREIQSYHDHETSNSPAAWAAFRNHMNKIPNLIKSWNP